LFLCNLLLGSVNLSLSELMQEANKTIFGLRLEEAIIALTAGASLSIGGLFMQSLFRNPLAGPSVLGISSGASLGVALAILFTGIGSSQLLPFYAILGALAFMFVLLVLSSRIRESVTLLIIGLLLGYGISAFIAILEFFSPAESLKKYVVWGMGSFFPSHPNAFWMMLLLNIPFIVLSYFLLKPMDAMLLGEQQAQTLGVNTKRVRFWVILITSCLTGAVTAYCGPIAFLGLMVPHLARFVFRTASHKILLSAVIIIGANLALLANLIAKLPGLVERVPVNIITSVLGIPVIIWIILEQKRVKVVS